MDQDQDLGRIDNKKKIVLKRCKRYKMETKALNIDLWRFSNTDGGLSGLLHNRSLILETLYLALQYDPKIPLRAEFP